MPNTLKKISELPVASPLVGTEHFPVTQDANTRKMLVSALGSRFATKTEFNTQIATANGLVTQLAAANAQIADMSNRVIPIYPQDTTSDPYWADTKLLMHFNGANGSQVFTDEKGHTFTKVGNPIISTAQSKFGGSSLYLDGSSALSCNQTDILSAGTDFSIEMWVWVSTLKQQWILDARSAAGTGSLYITMKDASGTLGSISNLACGTLVANRWHHLVYCRSSTVNRFYLDGVLTLSSATSPGQTANPLKIGCAYNSGTKMTGFIDDLRISHHHRGYAEIPVTPYFISRVSERPNS